MFLNDIDPQFIKSVTYLYTSETLVKGDSVPLQFYLEEAIKSKSGVSKDLSSVVSTSFNQGRVPDFKPFINALEESKDSSSDNELELALLNDDLMCIVCNGMDVGARNRLLECSDCHRLYHQECHIPIVINQDSFDAWVCQNCKDTKKQKLSVAVNLPSSTSSHVKIPSSSSPFTSVTSSTSSSSSKSSSSHRHSSASSSSSYKTSSSVSKSDKYSKSGSGASGGSSKTASASTTSGSSAVKPPTASSSTSRTNVTPSINIISADKRIQIMKKKAAKLQEKRKHSSR